VKGVGSDGVKVKPLVKVRGEGSGTRDNKRNWEKKGREGVPLKNLVTVPPATVGKTLKKASGYAIGYLKA